VINQQRQAWVVVGTLFVMLFFVLGGTANTVGVFLDPLMKGFGWDHARVSAIATAFALMMGLVTPLVGWLLDRIEASILMAIGAVMVGVGLLAASRGHSFLALFAAYFVVGTGVGFATLVPCSVVAANWFTARRGLAIGVTIAGAAVGAVAMPLIADYVIRTSGWRTALVVLAVPALLMAPLVMLIVRTRPAGEIKKSVAEEIETLPGLDLKAALATASFWTLAIAQMLASTGLSGAFYHAIPFLISTGFAPQKAALILSIQSVFVALGFVSFGALADRFTGRRIFPLALLLLTLGVLFLLGARSASPVPFVAAFIVAFGLSAGSTSSLMPVVLVETCGLKRFGTLAGLIGIATTIGQASGPIIVGGLVDATGSYAVALEGCAALIFAGAIGALMVSPAVAIEAATPRPARALH
jgi:MFS family permease